MRRREFIGLVGAVVALGVLAAMPFVPSAAHDWYPKECCHDIDCAPVDAVAWSVPTDGSGPQLIVTSKHGTVVVPRGFPRRASPDGRMHICIQGVYVMCIFMPPPL